ncbi:hypothetical protein [Halodesulfovibrio marinisediminis]|uniref:Tetratricopeptide repeat-containing protein n=1 Tax=Halodesulfovibrio marinisediminis DSM 17456 TaxID=1121457 RepID=A0A1N6DM90_9BACT|nr:hypothetical protein [Halodesulfovibrio marinisediminis]SIN71941.1 hypothetical protein SAMN02745161_0310 [Halodesulfovibrio marinisediminis DSM 17456]
MKRVLILIAMVALSGCALKSKKPVAVQRPAEYKVVASPYSSNSMQNLYIGRQYVAQQRYELAREHFLLALASAEHENMREQLVSEITAVNRLLETLR